MSNRRFSLSLTRADAAPLLLYSVLVLAVGWNGFSTFYRDGMQRWNEYALSAPANVAGAQAAADNGTTEKTFLQKAVGFVIMMTILGFVLFAASLCLLALQRTVRATSRRR